MMKLSIQYLLLSLIVINPLGLLVSAQESAKNPYEGKYELVTPPQPTNDPNKIEVVKLFWYTCPHCASLENNEHFKRWQKDKAEYVEFTRMPAVFTNDRWEALAKAYYTAEALGVLDQIHRPLFEAIHVPPKRRMNNKKALRRFFLTAINKDLKDKEGNIYKKCTTCNEHGENQYDDLDKMCMITCDDFNDTFDSFAVKQTKIPHAQDMTARYGITGVPVIIVNGKYRLTSEKTGGYKNMMKVIDYLIDVERKAMTSQTETSTQTKETKK